MLCHSSTNSLLFVFTTWSLLPPSLPHRIYSSWMIRTFVELVHLFPRPFIQNVPPKMKVKFAYRLNMISNIVRHEYQRCLGSTEHVLSSWAMLCSCWITPIQKLPRFKVRTLKFLKFKTFTCTYLQRFVHM